MLSSDNEHNIFFIYTKHVYIDKRFLLNLSFNLTFGKSDTLIMRLQWPCNLYALTLASTTDFPLIRQVCFLKTRGCGYSRIILICLISIIKQNPTSMILLIKLANTHLPPTFFNKSTNMFTQSVRIINSIKSHYWMCSI